VPLVLFVHERGLQMARLPADRRALSSVPKIVREDCRYYVVSACQAFPLNQEGPTGSSTSRGERGFRWSLFTCLCLSLSLEGMIQVGRTALFATMRIDCSMRIVAI
jgi:hypothetical protein